MPRSTTLGSSGFTPPWMATGVLATCRYSGRPRRVERIDRAIEWHASKRSSATWTRRSHFSARVSAASPEQWRRTGFYAKSESTTFTILPPSTTTIDDNTMTRAQVADLVERAQASPTLVETLEVEGCARAGDWVSHAGTARPLGPHSRHDEAGCDPRPATPARGRARPSTGVSRAASTSSRRVSSIVLWVYSLNVIKGTSALNISKGTK